MKYLYNILIFLVLVMGSSANVFSLEDEYIQQAKEILAKFYSVSESSFDADTPISKIKKTRSQQLDILEIFSETADKLGIFTIPEGPVTEELGENDRKAPDRFTARMLARVIAKSLAINDNLKNTKQ